MHASGRGSLPRRSTKFEKAYEFAVSEGLIPDARTYTVEELIRACPEIPQDFIREFHGMNRNQISRVRKSGFKDIIDP